MDRGLPLAVGAMLLALLLTGGASAAQATRNPVRALAAPVCADARPSPVINAVPWTQERYAPQRLAAFADGRGVTVAVIDSGVDARHPQLAPAVVPGRDLLDGGTGTVDCASHGTAVASIIAARPVPGVGFRGLAPAARVLPVRISEQQVVDGGTVGRTVPPAALVEAIRYAVSHGAHVINISVVLYQDHPEVRAAVREAVDADVVVVAAVGNLHDRGDPTPYPAAYPGVIGVGAIGPDGTRLPRSQVGSYVDIVAPGGQITAATRVAGHATYEGTSFAAPFVAATAALLRQYRPDEPADAVARRIFATADPAPGGPGSTEYGHGVLNPYRALTERPAVGPEPDPPAPLPAEEVDPAAQALSAQRTGDRRLALRAAAAVGLGALVTLALASVLPRGRRRRWRPEAP